jgi:hypothetical protein
MDERAKVIPLHGPRAEPVADAATRPRLVAGALPDEPSALERKIAGGLAFLRRRIAGD